MNYVNLLQCDIANGVGWRVSLFVSRLCSKMQKMF